MNVKNVRYGFTLIELFVVIVIIGIIATMGVAVFKGYKEKARITRSVAFAREIRQLALAEYVSQENPEFFVGWYDFEKVKNGDTLILDKSPSRNNISALTGTAVVFSDTPSGVGKSFSTPKGKVFSFSGIDSNKATFSFWFKDDNFKTVRKLPMDSVQFFFRFDSDGLDFRCGGAMYNDSIKEGQWHFIVGSYDGDTKKKKLWIDGDLVADKEGVNCPVSSNLAVRVGGGGDYSTGMLDDLMIFRGVFDGKEIYN